MPTLATSQTETEKSAENESEKNESSSNSARVRNSRKRDIVNIGQEFELIDWDIRYGYDENNRDTYNVFNVTVKSVDISRECDFDIKRIDYGLTNKKDSMDDNNNFISDYYYVTVKLNIKNEIVILTATSGDTGKAALAGFADVKGTRIIVFYPKNGVSPIQEKQMVTQKGANTFVVGIHGNFDDAQTGVKKIFSDKELAKEMDEKGFQFSSANSINIGRLVPQICYYVYAYAQLCKDGKIAEGEKINVVVPTGNFGNILAAFYAKNMGLPIDKLICASNDNKVLYDFFRTGTYDRNREFVLTTSPSMDILISSNLERLIYRIAGNDADKNRELMSALTGNGKYEITEEMKAQLADFYGNFASEAETAAEIRRLYEKCGYVIDTHTAVASEVYGKYVAETGDHKTTVIASTASPFKFTRSVMDAIDTKYDVMGDFELVDELSKIAKVKVPGAIEEIRTAPILHDTQCDVDKMKDTVKSFLGI
jgi:threonine synthase